MYISSAISKFALAFVAGCAIVSADKINYKVVSYVPANHTAGVLIDNQVYPLKVQDESTLYFTGEAPVAENGYKYVILDNNNNIAEQENFTRALANNKDTVNEYYNRTFNAMSLPQLPTVLDPLPIIHRIDSDLHIDGEIPTVHITCNQTAIDYLHSHPTDESYIPAYMTYISPNDVKVFKNMSIAVSGHSTRFVPKLSYKLKLDKQEGDLYGYRRFKLRAMPMDMTYMKEELAYDIANKMGLPTTQSSYIRLYVNDQPIGLFGLVENFKNPWLRNVFADGEKYDQGAFFVADVNLGKPVTINQSADTQLSFSNMNMNNSNDASHRFDLSKVAPNSTSDLSYLGDNATLYVPPYSIKEDPSVGTANFTRIMELTKFISQQPNDTMVDDANAEAWEKVLDVESALRSLAFDVIISNFDGYSYMANNYILYDDLVNERMVMSNQDLDLSMGLIANDELVTGNYSEFAGFSSRPLTTTLLKVPKYKQRFEELLYNTTVALLNPGVMYPRIDALSNFLIQDVEWDKSLPRVAKTGLDFSSFIPFPLAVNGSSAEYLSNSSFLEVLSGVGLKTLFLKEWVQTRSDNLLTFFNGTNTTVSA